MATSLSISLERICSDRPDGPRSATRLRHHRLPLRSPIDGRTGSWNVPGTVLKAIPRRFHPLIAKTASVSSTNSFFVNRPARVHLCRPPEHRFVERAQRPLDVHSGKDQNRKR